MPDKEIQTHYHSRRWKYTCHKCGSFSVGYSRDETNHGCCCGPITNPTPLHSLAEEEAEWAKGPPGRLFLT